MNIYQKIQVVQATIGKIPKESSNPFYNKQYSDINTILEHLQPILNDVGLLLIQPIEDGIVCTRLIDVETEREINSCLTLPQLTDPQKLGSCITYYRRYTLKSLLSLQDEDDDGNAASYPTEPEEKKEWLTEEQYHKTLAGTPTQIKKVLDLYTGNGKAMKKAYREELEKKLTEKTK